MTPERYIAQAAALRVVAAIAGRNHLFCQELPPMDVGHFLQVLGDARLDLQSVSLALVGYGVSDADLRSRLNRLGLAVDHASTDLHIAAAWRNMPEDHPCIIALAVGRHPGVSTLAHFPQGTTRELVEVLLNWALSPTAELVATARQRDLLEALAETRELAPLASLSSVAAFLAAWRAARQEDELDAPRRSLPRLGLLPDRNLLSVDRSVADRMVSNFSLTRTLTSMPGSRLDALRRRVRKDNDASRRDQMMSIIQRVEVLRRVGDLDAYGALEFEDAQRLVKPSKEDKQPSGEEPSPEPSPEDPVPDLPAVRGKKGVSSDGGAALIDGDDARLSEIVEGVEAALAEALEQETEEARGSYEVGGEELAFQFDVDRAFLTWIRAFCSETVWGDIIGRRARHLRRRLRTTVSASPSSFVQSSALSRMTMNSATCAQFSLPCSKNSRGPASRMRTFARSGTGSSPHDGLC